MRRLWLPIIGVLAVATAACGTGSAATDPAPSCSARAAHTGDSLTAARAVAVAYVSDIAAHRYDAAERVTEPCGMQQYRAIRLLWKFMAGMPVGQSRVTAVARRGGTWPGSARVTVTVFIRFGKPPSSAWIAAAVRTLALDSRPGGWRVTSDETQHRKGKLSVYGFGSYQRPVFLSGKRATVVYSAGSREADARAILRAADGAVGQLWRRYGGGRAARRPIIFLVENRHQAERLAHVQLGRVRTPAGFQYSSYAYIDLPQWEAYDRGSRRSMVVHELTHVATRAWLRSAPHSLAEGVAMFEENRWRVHHHLRPIPLLGLGELYKRGFPSGEIWTRRQTDWGLRNLIAIQYSYLDAMTMVQQIVARHGGVAALRRLGAAFAATPVRRIYTFGQVDAAFRRALGVPFAQVAAEARAAAGG